MGVIIMNFVSSASTGAFIAAVLVFIGGLFTLKQTNKKIFINKITNARKEYIKVIRKKVAKFCAMAVSENQNKTEGLLELSYFLKLLMNPAGDNDNKWDRRAVDLIDVIIQKENKDKKNDIDRLIIIMQSWIAIEWSGMTDESKKGTLKKEEKKKLREKYSSEYEEYLRDKKLNIYY